jgi:hypothetical protein
MLRRKMPAGQRAPVLHRYLAALTAKATPFNVPGWIFELKYESFRVLGRHKR